MNKYAVRRKSVAAAMVSIFTLVIATGASAQSGTPPSSDDALKDHLMEGSKEVVWDSQKAVDALLALAAVAETSHNFRPAADDVALATMKSTNFAQRDSLQLRLRTIVQHLRHASDGDAIQTAQVDSEVSQTLDRAFQTAFDHGIHVTPAQAVAGGRTVVAEYITGIQCGPCWIHDRLYAALLQRYAGSHNVVVLAYHDGPGYPIAHEGDQLWGHIASAGPGEPGLYKTLTTMAAGDIGWIDGDPVTYDISEIHDRSELPAAEAKMYAALATAIDQQRRRPPGATVSLSVTPGRVSDTALDSVTVQVHVATPVGTRHLGIRLALVEDTVRVAGFTNRRLQYSAVRTVAWFNSQHRTKDLFFQLPKGVDSATVTYTFDVAALQRSLMTTHDSSEWARNAFPDPRSWRMQPRRLGVVAIVQDLKTLEVLQTAYQRVVPATP